MTRLVYFTAEWCAPCKKFAPLVEREAAARGLPLGLEDIDRPHSADLARRLDVQSVPTVIAIRNGEVVDRFGVVPAATLRERLDRLAEEPA